MNFKELLGMRVEGEPIFSPQLVTTVLEKLSWMDARIDVAVDKEYLKVFKKRHGSLLIIARPVVLEKLFEEPLGFRFTCDDFIILEYDPVANDIPKTVVSRLAEEETKLVDRNDGLLIIGK